MDPLTHGLPGAVAAKALPGHPAWMIGCRCRQT